MITIDGAHGEGGGQMLRTSLALSLITGEPFRMVNVRAARARPGLRPQHLAAVEAAAAVGDATLDGAYVGSREVLFRPRAVRPGDYRFAIGTAGSATLVLQTVLPALVVASAPSRLTLEGGTHNPLAPPFDFVERTYLPLLRRMGPHADAALERHGFYPVGGGRFTVTIEPVARLSPLVLVDRGDIVRCRARAFVSRLPRRIAEREIDVVRRALGLAPADVVAETVDAAGPGNAVVIDVETAQLTEVISAVGQRGVRAEIVAERAVREARDYVASGVPVGTHLADQLLLPLALAGAGQFRTMPLTLHATTNMDVIRAFVAVDFDATPAPTGDAVDVIVRA